MSKQVRLEVPLYYNGKYLSKVWLKIIGNETTAFFDADCTRAISGEFKKIFIDVDVPDNLELIKVSRPNYLTPVDFISMSWAGLEKHYNLRILELQKLSIIFDDRIYDIPFYNGLPNREYWVSSIREEGKQLFFKNWALVLSVFKNRAVGTLYLNSKC